MVPARFNYLAILGVLLVFVLSAYSGPLLRLSRKSEFWISGALYLVACLGLELVGLSLSWWQFDWAQVCGLTLWGVPAEEFLLFGIIFALSIAAWEELP